MAVEARGVDDAEVCALALRLGERITVGGILSVRMERLESSPVHPTTDGRWRFVVDRCPGVERLLIGVSRTEAAAMLRHAKHVLQTIIEEAGAAYGDLLVDVRRWAR